MTARGWERGLLAHVAIALVAGMLTVSAVSIVVLGLARCAA